MRHLHLFVHSTQPLDGRDLPALGRLLRRGRPLAAPGGISAAFCQAQGIVRQRDWPVAALSARAAGLDPGTAHWLRLDPVYLDVGTHGPYLRTGLVLAPAETAALGALLAPLLTPHGMTPMPGSGGVIHVRCATPPRLETTPLDEVADRHPMRFLPTGEDAPLWTRLLHEIQMILHEHPLNVARMAAGQAPVNSLWPWGVGSMPGLSPSLDAVWGRHALLEQMARGLDIPVRLSPAGLDEVLASRQNRGLVLLEEGEAGDAAALAAWDTAWFRPLGRALGLGRLRSATVGWIGASGQARLLTPGAMWRFWA